MVIECTVRLKPQRSVAKVPYKPYNGTSTTILSVPYSKSTKSVQLTGNEMLQIDLR